MARRIPLIGVLAIATRVPFPTEPTPVTLVPDAYLDAITDSGGAPLVVAIGIDPASVLDRLGGIMLLGGSDIDPARYRAERHRATGVASSRRDASEAAFIALATDRDLPVLGICRGTQMMNVTRGGTLIQHLPDLVGENVHSSATGPCRHSASAVAGTKLASIIGTGALDVVSTHHQAVGAVAPGLIVNATAPDGTIEGIEDPSSRFFLGVQWHPEHDDDRRIFRALVDAAAATP